MSKHPIYLAVDEKRLQIIPIAFEKYSNEKFRLVKVQPESKDDYQPWPHYVIYDTKDSIAAVFYANGKSECISKSFRKIHEKMVFDIEKAAFEMKKEVEKDLKRMEAEKHGFDPTFYEKEKEYLETQKKES
ncbi:MAG: hypothetical protein FK733_17865 [Asgard group archaeon]|nr:hypothetical protein [Asgard group archaeon]